MTTAKKGHNSTDPGRLKSLGQRIMKLNEDKAEVLSDIKEVYAEAKHAGYDTKILRHVIRELERDKAERAERDELVAIYLAAFE